jgi:DNA-binding transcriptional LysR family regulator
MATTRQLEIFVKIAQLGSMRLAADALDISQPSASKQMKALERHMGGELFLRSRGQRVRLSPLGAVVLEDAIDNLRTRERMLDTARDVKRTPPVRVFVRGFVHEVIGRRLESLQAQGLPKTVIFVLVDDSEAIFEKVSQDANSLAILRSAAPFDAGVVQGSILQNESASIYASPELAQALKSGARAIKTVDVFVHPRRHAEAWDRRLLEQAGFASASHVPAPQFLELLTGKLIRGEGIAVLLDWHAAQLVQEGLLEQVSELSEPIYFMLVANQAFDKRRFGEMIPIFKLLG